MKKPRRMASHAAVFLLGLALGGGTLLLRHGGGAGQDGGREGGSGAGDPAGGGEAKTGKRPQAARAGGSREEFRAAWELLAESKDPIRVRLQQQQLLLEAWAEVDLEAAMQAALGEAWDDDANKGGEHPLVYAFAKVFAERPLEAWRLIGSGKFGVGAQLLRTQWIQAVAPKHGMLVASMLPELPPSNREAAIMLATRRAGGGEKLTRIIEQIAGFPPGPETEEWLRLATKAIPDGGDPVELRGRWLGVAEGAKREVAIQTWAASLRQADEAKLAVEWAGIPEAERGEAAKAVLQQLYPDSRGLLPAMNVAMASGEWQLIAKQGPEWLREHEIAPQQLAEWGMTLPERAETVELFHRSVDRYIGEDLPRAREWIAEMPEGDWRRDRALAEYSQQSLWKHGNAEESQWALEQIGNPELRKNAEGWRGDWAAARGGSGN
ncbi:hypothetical protein [Luteolibacter sp. Populi]|uniref:hypothetical protein n=1 Tax=Luteolibacter sp. Populi TaxID=3230487 RepID=UPI0034665987